MKSRVGKYLITKQIATGGMGAIYKAKHPTLNRDVILKELTLKGNRAINERFKREAQFMIDFRNDHIVQVFDHFKEGDSYYIVMEYVDGITLAKLIDKNRYLPSDIAVLIYYEICRALKHAHDRGVVHRDIKPDNVLISKEGVVKITDFGIATSKDSEEQGLTRNMTLGTPAYMSPEQITDSKNVDNRADIYSCGVVLYEMVTGKCPFPGNFSPETINAIQKGKYIKPRKVNPRVTPAVQKIIRKSMHHNRKRRFRDLAQLLSRLEGYVKKCRDEDLIKETIRAYIYDNKVQNKKAKKGKKNGYAKERNYRAIALTLGCASAVIGGAVWYGYTRGYHHEIYQANEFGALEVELLVRKIGDGSGPRYIQGKLLVRDRGRFIAVDNVNLNFSRDRDMNKDGYLRYSSQRVYMKTAPYRLYLDVDENLYQRDIFLKPREIQKREKESNDAQIVVIKHEDVKSVPLDISYGINDGNTGADITADSEFYIRYFNKWILWKDFISMDKFAKLLETGKTYYFKINHKDYFEKYMSIDVDAHQSELHIQTELQPLPGIVYVRSDVDGPQIFVNNASYYMYGGREKKLEELKNLSRTYTALILSPGSYYITVKYKSIARIESVEVLAGKKLKLNVHFDEKNGSIEFMLN